MEKLADKFFQQTARIENVLILAGIIPSLTLTDALRDFFLHDQDEIQTCFGEIPGVILEEIESGDTGSMCDWLISTKKFGFLVQIATPVKEWTPSGNASYSWGHYYTKWFYGDTLDDSIQKGFLWIKGLDTKNKLKAGV